VALEAKATPLPPVIVKVLPVAPGMPGKRVALEAMLSELPLASVTLPLPPSEAPAATLIDPAPLLPLTTDPLINIVPALIWVVPE
jgi:hypothetical protein